MNIHKLLNIGVVGVLIAALCCFTPILVLLLVAIGFSAITGYLNFVLYPVLVIFIAITLYALWNVLWRRVRI